MAMKKTDLEKNKALKLIHTMKQPGADRFGRAAPPAADRREQRRLDQAQGLVPFACKLNVELVARLNAHAQAHPGGVGALLAELIEKGLPPDAP